MTVERDIAGFALPFAAGVLSVSLFSFFPYYAACAWTLPAIVLACTWTHLVARSRKPDSRIWAGIIAAAFLTGIFCFCNASIMSVTKTAERGFIYDTARQCCIRLQEATARIPFLHERTSALLTALLTGERSSIPHEVKEAFRSSGASHILALSGMHLGIIYGIIKAMLSILGNRRQAVIARSVLTLLACGFYTIGVGAGESIVRAFLFILLNETARMTHRYRDLRQILFAALVIQLAISPLSIRSVGFQLSYAAMAGITFIHPWLRGFWPDDGTGTDPLRKIWDSASLSISCQLTTAPVAWYYFESFPTHFLLTNLLALPLTGAIIPAALTTVLLHSLGICPDLLIRLTESLVSALITSLTVISGM